MKLTDSFWKCFELDMAEVRLSFITFGLFFGIPIWQAELSRTTPSVD
jgi:hypothetical protein